MCQNNNSVTWLTKSVSTYKCTVGKGSYKINYQACGVDAIIPVTGRCKQIQAKQMIQSLNILEPWLNFYHDVCVNFNSLVAHRFITGTMVRSRDSVCWEIGRVFHRRR